MMTLNYFQTKKKEKLYLIVAKLMKNKTKIYTKIKIFNKTKV